MDKIPEFGDFNPAADYLLRPAGHAVICDNQSQVALVETPKGVFFPGGALEPDETPGQAAVRETIEECGLEVRTGKFLGVADELVYDQTEATHFRKRCHFFIAEVVSDATSSEPDHQLIWVPAGEVFNRLTYESHQWAFQQFRQSRL